jgi:hypothetical protein
MTLTEFLIFLGQNSQEYDDYASDPKAYVAQADLSPAHKFLLDNGDDEHVMAEVEFEAAAPVAAASAAGTVNVKRVTRDAAGPNIKRFIELE